MSEQAIRDHLVAVRPQRGASALPPHFPTCLGCGPDAPAGFHLSVSRDGDDVVTTHVFTPAQEGGPGLAHGGAVATVVDDLLGYLLWVIEKPGVTRKLDVEYLRPVVLGQEYAVRGRVDSVDGRKVWVSCEGRAPDGEVSFRATGLFIAVPLSHFDRALQGAQGARAQGEPPVDP